MTYDEKAKIRIARFKAELEAKREAEKAKKEQKRKLKQRARNRENDRRILLKGRYYVIRAINASISAALKTNNLKSLQTLVNRVIDEHRYHYRNHWNNKFRNGKKLRKNGSKCR